MVILGVVTPSPPGRNNRGVLLSMKQGRPKVPLDSPQGAPAAAPAFSGPTTTTTAKLLHIGEQKSLRLENSNEKPGPHYKAGLFSDCFAVANLGHR